GLDLRAGYLAAPQPGDLHACVGEAGLPPVVLRDLGDAAGMRADPVRIVLTGLPRKLPDVASFDGASTSHRLDLPANPKPEPREPGPLSPPTFLIRHQRTTWIGGASIPIPPAPLPCSPAEVEPRGPADVCIGSGGTPTKV